MYIGSYYEIDMKMTYKRSNDETKEQIAQLANAANQQDMIHIRQHTQNNSLLDCWSAGLLVCWSTNRDRINGWLFHVLRSDERQAHLHRSMLVESDINDEIWARLVLKHWNLDGAATGRELGTLLSIGAVDSCD